MKGFLWLLLIAIGPPSYSQTSTKKPLKVSALFSDGMVLQQKTNVNLWGNAHPAQKITATTTWGAQASTKANATGKWKLKLATPKAGGPYVINIKTSDDAVVVNKVLVGEVWLASGQSNMDIPVKGWPPGDTILNSAQEIRSADYPSIRFLKVPFNVSAVPLDSFRGKWTPASPQTAGDFSATAYFYARKLYQELKVPIGIIQSSIGGTPAEAWTSKECLLKLGDFTNRIESLSNLQASTEAWFKKWAAQDVPNTKEAWQNISFLDGEAASPDYDDSKWITIKLPGRFDLLHPGEFDGAMWFRKEFAVDDISTDYKLNIGAVDDMDATYVNGKKIGGLAGAGVANLPREMVISKSLLLKGKNSIAIRAIDNGGGGAISGRMTISNANGITIRLEGEWKCRLVAEIYKGKFYTYGLEASVAERPDVSQLNSNSPTVLFNAMINPLVPYTIKGVIWYQGESNVGRAEQYKRLFPNMIKDWRAKWGAELPFYYVQLAPYIYKAADQSEQSQKLRDAQRYALKLPKTGMVSTLDIGYLKTAHPPYKQEVGARLARFALANEYGKKLVASGPLYKKATASGNELIIEFASVGSGLIASAKGLTNFEIAGAGKVYVPAQAKIVNNQVVVSSRSIANPVYARYAWSDSSAATLFNKEGLPAATFTSEE